MIFEVGKPVAQFRGIAEGPRISCNGSGFFLLDVRAMPTQEEIQAFRSGERFQYGLCEAGGLFFFLYKAGTLEWNDAPILSVGNAEAGGTMLTAMLVDCATGVVCALRGMGVCEAFVSAWQRATEAMKERNLSPMEISRKMDRAYAMFSTKQMVRMAGEIYEVHAAKDAGTAMRRSLRSLPAHMVRKDQYPGLPDELKEFNYWIADSGRSIMAIPETVLPRAEAEGDLELFEVPVPVKYVLEKGYRMYKGHVIVDAEYDSFLGLVVPEEYTEW